MTPSESNPNCLTCRVQGASAIRKASEAARAFGEAQWLADDELARLCVVVEELVANLYDHGGLTDRDQVELRLEVDPEGVRVSIADPGKPFDPWTMPLRSERTERGGNAGIGLIRAWAHFVSYDSSTEGNRLEFLVPVNWEG